MTSKTSKTDAVPFKITGVPGSGAWAYLALSLAAGPDASLSKVLPRVAGGPLVMVRKSEEDLEDIEDALSSLAPLFPGSESLSLPAFFGEDPQRRLASLERLHGKARLVLAVPGGLGAAAPSPGEFSSARLVLRMGQSLPMAHVLERLAVLGYQRVDFVGSPGEFAVRGAVVDVHALEPLRAVRLLFNENLIESIRVIDIESQSGGAFLEELALTPAGASAKSLVLDWLADAPLWLVEDGVDVRVPQAAQARVGTFADSAFDLGALPSMHFQGNLDLAARQINQWRAQGWKILLYSINRGEDERIAEMLQDRVPEGACQFLIGPLRSGFLLPGAKTAVMTTSEIFERSYRPSKTWSKFDAPSQRLRPAELKAGDYVVHQEYGIARYRGIRSVETAQGSSEQGAQDCLMLEYRNNDKVYVPMADFRLVQKFIGAEGHRPRLSSLDTRTWEQVKAKVQEGVRELAEQLLKVSAARASVPGHAFQPDTHMETEFAEAFPYEETPDQRRAIEEVKADMTSAHPMDRVVVGDVGFGKTEVAMRACLKCVAGLKQAAVLVPTTILADQHYRTFTKRFAEYPVRIAMLSRFTIPKEARQAVEDLGSGKLDIVIATHRLLSPDIRFKDLGLLVIDEEHRFGVRDKENLKALKRDVDVLTLSATPIPRTLHQSLTGLKPVSLIQSAPSGRQPIVTQVGPWSESAVVRAIQAELDRNGQIYYVYNRVRGLPEKVEELRSLLPGVKFAMAHGQMRAEPLEKTMWDFFNRKFQVLVASSIIESGLDIPTVNTLLVENAQDFGLAQLYQLRGRIGRERQKAYCHLFYPSGARDMEQLPEEARQRLTALREFAALGSGLKLAMRDLEIRGAGDLLGAKQHGFINAVGVEFYSELLQGEIEGLKGKKRALEPLPVQLDLGLSAYIPEDYLPGESERLAFYKRLIAARAADLPVLRRELEDLSGPLPKQAANLFRLMEARIEAGKAGLREAARRGDWMEMRFRAEACVPADAVAAWHGAYAGRMEFVRDPEGDGLRVRVDGPFDALAWLEAFLRPLADC